MQDLGRVTEIGHVIQLAVAAVFLLSGVGAMLGVLTNRLARIIDHGRALEAALPLICAVIVALFLREIVVATRHLRIGAS